MNASTKHRGPDASGFFIDGVVSLGHNLLAITDTTKNSIQPLISSHKRYVLSYNGEIYNYKDLRKELKQKGEVFYTDSDTEVLLKGLIRYGVVFLDQLDGMFALALYDKEKGTVLLARDSNGMKPLYFYHENGLFIFSSEIGGILIHDVLRKLNTEALNIFLFLGYVPGPHTLIQGIQKVSPGQYLTFDLYKNNLEKKWFISAHKKSKKQIINFHPDTLRDIMGRAVSSHTMGLRPFGLFLSGGLDSTIILHELAHNKKDFINTYTTRFTTTNSLLNEDADLAKKLCHDYNIHHHELLVSEDNFIDATVSSIEAMEEPRFNPSVAAYWLLTQQASKDIVVVLNGSGGDELFLGYRRYIVSRNMTSHYMRYPSFLLNIYYSLRALRNKILAPGHFLHLDDSLERWAYLNNISSHVRNKAFKIDENFDIINLIAYIKSIGHPYINISSIGDVENWIGIFDRLLWLADEDFIRTDKIAMHFSMEARSPFLAKELINYANTISSNKKMSSMELKLLLRKAYENHLPDYIIHKKKTGWNAPIAQWMHSKFGGVVRDVLSEDFYRPTGELFDFDFIQGAYINNVSEFTKDHIRNFLPIFSFQIWAKKFNIQI